MIKRILFIILTVSLLISAFSVHSFATGQSKSVYDLANMFTDEEIIRMENAASEYFGKTDCNVYIVTDPSPYSVTYWGEEFIDDYLGGKSGNSVILIITDNYDRNYDIYTYGKCDRRISNGEVNDILDAPTIYNNIKGGKNYDEAVCEFIRMSADAIRTEYVLATVVAILSGAAIAGITALCIVCSYKKKQRSEKYPLDRYASLELTTSNDLFMGSFITKRVIRQSSSGGGRGGFRGGGGGGGGHRGGR